MSVMCRRATEADRVAIKELWQVAFPEDSEVDVEAFFDVFSPESHAFVLCDEDNLCSMLFLLSATLEYDNKRTPVGYIYAGATHPTFRGNGFYKQLIAYVEGVAKADGVSVLMLQPATRELSHTYRRMGFERPLFCTERPLTEDDLTNSTSVTPGMFAAHRREWMRANGHAFIDWDDAVYAYAAKWCEAIITADGQWLWISQDSDRVWECIPWRTSDIVVAPFAKSICHFIDFKQIEFAFPIWFGYGLM